MEAQALFQKKVRLTKPVEKQDINEAIKQEAKKIRDILKFHKIVPKMSGVGDYQSSKITKDTTLLSLGFEVKTKASQALKVLVEEFGYVASLKDSVIQISLNKTPIKKVPIKNQPTLFSGNSAIDVKENSIEKSVEKTPEVKAITTIAIPAPLKGDQYIYDMRDKRLAEEVAKLQQLKDRAKRIMNLVIAEFGLTSVKTDKANGYRSSKITNTDIKGYRIGLPTREKALEVKTFLESKHYLVSINNTDLTISLDKTTNEVKEIKHEEISTVTKMQSMIEDLKTVQEKALTAHLTPEMIGSRVWDYMESNQLHVVDGMKKLSVADLLRGTQLATWDKDSFVLLVTEALK